MRIRIDLVAGDLTPDNLGEDGLGHGESVEHARPGAPGVGTGYQVYQ